MEWFLIIGVVFGVLALWLYVTGVDLKDSNGKIVETGYLPDNEERK